jgi:mono/diheme cytochrome c family protein
MRRRDDEDPRMNGARVVRVTRRAAAVALMAAAVTATGCGGPGAASDDARPYLDDAGARRAELTASLVNPNNGYSSLRLAHYATGTSGDWDALPEWNPPTEAIAATELDAPGGASPTAISAPERLVLPANVTSMDDPALLALGKAAFERYPAQLAPYLSVALGSRAAAATVGLWVDEARGAGGVVRAQMADGSGALALTCSTCHGTARSSGVADGVPNASLNLGQALVDANPGLDAATASNFAAWGTGRVDVTTVAGTEPARIPDLRPVRFLTYLQQDATVEKRDRVALAIRIETLIITSSGQVLRPPRIVALALAAYVESLADALPDASAAASASPRGAQVFSTECAPCHAPPRLTGPPIALTEVQTDPTLGLSVDRGTGAYRVPSLHGVASRGPLLHDGTVPSLAAMFDPTRPTPAFTERLHGAGPVPGHTFGLALTPDDRAALVDYLERL